MSAFLIESILVDRSGRQRQEIEPEAVAEMADSFSRLGQIQPIVLRRDGTLVAGETRLLAARQLGWTHIEVTFTDELDSLKLHLIELEENTKRTDLPWQDQALAIKRYHELQKELDPTWNRDQTAKALGLATGETSEKIAVAKALEEGDARVLEAPRFSTARNIVRRSTERERLDQMSLVPSAPETPKEVLNTDFMEWAPRYEGSPFTLIHCDFPYGIDADSFNQGAAPEFGGYKDSATHYFNLLDCLCAQRNRLLGNIGHVFFWFSMTHYQRTLDRLREHFWVDPMPFIWHKSDNKGTLPWPEMSGRRVYETALLCSHGERKLIAPVSNLFSAPLGERIHMSQKNQIMLQNFFRMFVDKNSRVLDPTCGSGTALRAAKALGAASVLGLEINPEFARDAELLIRSAL